ncbi:putative proteophosphoglycan ppg4 [Rosellinia necatrix]|uniref:Putative proteophosphoglycan ppg4 n=1 Tax=Rosellinia necatrix TaxID=77044 RepID=A0A1W2TNF7_ROSNE|nr:putative proteophosphoglycan ppg4 [Rosellinia necatrix]
MEFPLCIPQQGRTYLQRNASGASMSYDLSPYEAQRLLNLAAEPFFPDESIASESQLHASLSRQRSYTNPYHPTPSDAVALLPRNNSDASLYTPMRRRSLMTPGVATRPPVAEPIVPPAIQTGYALHSEAPSHDTPGFAGAGFLPIPHPSFDQSYIPRVHTPCEADYKQTGAFKHGTLRITNGSPARTPACQAADEAIRNGSQLQDEENVDVDSNVAAMAGEQEAAIAFLPELSLTISPFSLSDIGSESPELQITSKHTAIEDELFEDSSHEYDTEVLNVCFDKDAKPPLDEGKQKGLDRSDSGVVTSRLPGLPHKSLSKADSGYSSNVSIRSLSSRRNEQRGTGHSRNLPDVSPQGVARENVKPPSNVPVWTRSINVGSSETESQIPLFNESPPPVPEKDHTKALKSVTSRPHNSPVPAGKHDLVSDDLLVGEALTSAHHLLPDLNGTCTMSSTPNISNARKPGKLQRILSGARIPLTGQVTHVLDKEGSARPISQAAHENLHQCSGSSPRSFDNPVEGIGIMKGDLKITKAGKTSVTHDHDFAIRAPGNGPGMRRDQEKARGFRANLRLHSIGSTITRAASSVMAKTPMLRRPTPTPKNSSGRDASHQVPGTAAATTNYTNVNSQLGHMHAGDMDHPMSPPLASGRGLYGERVATAGRSNSLLSSRGGSDFWVHGAVRHNSLASQSGQYRTALQTSSFPGQYSVSGIPPPISMKTRNIGPLRVPPPIRPRSTPPVRSGMPTLSHKSSREGIQSYPPYNCPTSSNYTALPRQPSQESFYAYSAAQIQEFLNQSSRMPSMVTNNPSGIQSVAGEHWAAPVPGGLPNPQPGVIPSWEPSFDRSRRNSLASQTSQRSALSNRQPWPHHTPYDYPALRHRSSYDGYPSQTRQGYGQDTGPWPVLSRGNGQPYAPDPLSGQLASRPASQYQQHARHVSRGHLRHHSLDQYGSPIPYRVLHSYNSPAYRGVPIWSN